jgi:hypothetical protein
MKTATLYTPKFQSLTWHQQQARRRAWQTRNLPAHIRGDDYATALCGHKNPLVTIEPWHRGNPDNQPCKRCAAIAEKRNLPTEKPAFEYPSGNVRAWPY